MIIFHELSIGNEEANPCPRCLRAGGTKDTPLPAPVNLAEITPRIQQLQAAGASVMMRSFEPFRHPDLVGIIQSLAGQQVMQQLAQQPAAQSRMGVRRIGMRTDASALANLHDAQGCIDNGVRVFEVPFLPQQMDALSQAASLEARLAGIAGIQTAAQALGKPIFTCVDIYVCKHTAPYFADTVQSALAAGANAIRISASQELGTVDIATLVGGRFVLDAAHASATRNSVPLFGDGCSQYMQGAVIYETRVAAHV